MRPLPPERNPGPPYAELEQTGRWSWHLRVYHGVSVVDSALIHGSRRRADRIAGRRLARWQAIEARSARSQHRITS